MFALIPKSLIPGYGFRSMPAKLAKHKVLLSALDLAGEHDSQPTRHFHQITGDIITPGQVMGIDHLRDPRLNKGLAFTLEERQALGIHGLQPARFKTQEEQLELCRISIMRYQEDLNKYLYMNELHDRNEKLFFRLLSENVEMLMPIVYTPTVGLACQKFGLIYRRPRGLFVTLNDKGHCFDVLKNWPEHDVKAVVVTDGERILGLGDLGACGMGIPVGKLALYTALAGIKPHQCLPITVDVGTNNQSLLEDPLYIGLRQKRVVGPEYDEFIDEFMQAIVKRYGQDTLIQFEDFGNHNAFRFLEKYRTQYCTFNDDIQGTASVVVAGLLASVKITKRKLSDQTYCFLGAGGAACGIANLCVKQMQLEGLTVEEAQQRIWMVDINGLLTKSRPEGLNSQQMGFAKEHKDEKSLLSVVQEVKPSVLIGVSATGGTFTPEILKLMGKHHDRPIVFALSNPTSNSECTAEAAYTNTDGRVVFASGSPFDNVILNGKEYHPGQGNNAYVFPGIALGVICSRIHHIREELFLIAAQVVAENVSPSDLEKGQLYPPLSAIRECSVQIATKIAAYAYEQGIATLYPEPKDKRVFVESQTYDFNYEQSLPNIYPWKTMPDIKTRPLSASELTADKK